MKLTTKGIPVSVERIEDVGRHRIVRTRMEGHVVTALLQEREPLPADLHVSFEPEGVHLYADSWRIDLNAKAAP